MKIQLIKETIFAALNTEEELADLSVLESIYQIRTLKALAESLENGFIEATIKPDGQAYSSEFDIGFHYVDYVAYGRLISLETETSHGVSTEYVCPVYTESIPIDNDSIDYTPVVESFGTEIVIAGSYNPPGVFDFAIDFSTKDKGFKFQHKIYLIGSYEEYASLDECGSGGFVSEKYIEGYDNIFLAFAASSSVDNRVNASELIVALKEKLKGAAK